MSEHDGISNPGPITPETVFLIYLCLSTYCIYTDTSQFEDCSQNIRSTHE